MLLSAVSVLVVAQSSSEIPEGLMNNPVFIGQFTQQWFCSVCSFVLGDGKLCIKMFMLETNYIKLQRLINRRFRSKGCHIDL